MGCIPFTREADRFFPKRPPSGHTPMAAGGRKATESEDMSWVEGVTLLSSESHNLMARRSEKSAQRLEDWRGERGCEASWCLCGLLLFWYK